MKWTVALLLALVVFAPVARAQTPAPAAGPSTLRVTVKDATDSLSAARGGHAHRCRGRRASGARGRRRRGHVPGTAAGHVSGAGQRRRVPAGGAAGQRPPRRQHHDARRWRSPSPSRSRWPIRRADDRRDNGFTQTLTADEIDALSDDPDEMAEQLAQMAGPGAQIFVDGFRGGRLPPKDQIQQIRFNTNSFSAEYHEAGMVRVEVITRPGMGGWRGRANFGFRDESLNARNAFSDDKGAEQQQRYMFSFQGPLAKGKTGLSMSVDGNNAYDSRTIRAQAPSDVTVNGLAKNTTDGVNANFRVDHSMGAGQPDPRGVLAPAATIAATSASATSICRSAPTTPTPCTDTFRLRNTRVIGKKVFSELKFEFTSSNSTTLPLSTAPTVRVNDAFTAGGAGQSGDALAPRDRDRAELRLHHRAQALDARRRAVRGRLVGQHAAAERQRHLHLHQHRRLQPGPAGHLHDPRRRSAGRVLAGRRPAGSSRTTVRLAKTLSVSLGVRQEIQTQVNDWFNLAPRAAFTWNATRKTTVRGGYGIFYDWYDSNLYEQTMRVDGEHQVDVVVQNPSFPVGAGTRRPAAGQHHPRRRRSAQPIIQQASIGLERPLDAVGGPAHRLHVDARLQHAAVGQRQRAGQRRAAGSDGRQHHRDPVERQARQRSAHRGGERAASSGCASSRNVMYQLQSTRNYADRRPACRRTAPTPMPTGDRRRRTCGIACS